MIVRLCLPLALLAACTPRTPDAAPGPDAAATAAAPAAATERLTITFDPRECRAELAFVRCEPDRDRKSAEYTTYLLDAKSVEAVLGAEPAGPVAVIVEVGPPTEERYTPDDPNLPQPDGGFVLITRSGRVVAKAP